MKKLFVILLLFPIISISQDYADLFKISYGYTFNSKFKGTSESTDVNTFETGLIFPVKINDRQTLITGLNFDYNNLMVFPDSEIVNLYSTTLRFGFATNYSEKWSSTIVLLPKIASDYTDISLDDFYLGGFAIFKNKKRKSLFYRYGFYMSQEAFGITFTPILGAYYTSPNNNFEADISLPIAANINYSFGSIALGFDYFGIERSYRLQSQNDMKTYVEQNRLEFSNYVQFNNLIKSVLLRVKFGYAVNDHKIFEEEEKIDFKFIDFAFGDDRQRLNPKLNGSIFAKLEAIFRFSLVNSD